MVLREGKKEEEKKSYLFFFNSFNSQFLKLLKMGYCISLGRREGENLEFALIHKLVLLDTVTIHLPET